MRHGLFTLALAAALTACSKPNPLFLDTWEGLSEGASQITAVTTEDATATMTSTTVDPTTSTTVDETTTTTANATASSEPPTGTVTTGPGCTSKVLAPVPVNRDTFVVEHPDIDDSCTLDGSNNEVFPDHFCRFLEFGGSASLSLFKGTEPNLMKPRVSVYLLDFARDDAGQLATDEGVVPHDRLEKVTLRLAYSDPGEYGFEKAVVDVYAIPLEVGEKPGPWVEGEALGELCKDAGAANFQCARCKVGEPPSCAESWFGLEQFPLPDPAEKLLSAELAITDKLGSTADIPLDPDLFGKTPNGGLMVVMSGMVKGMQILQDVPPGPLRMHAREYPNAMFRPALLVEACL